MMNYELTLKKEGYKESEIRDESIFTKLKKMAHENLFFFGIFLTLLYLVQSLPFWTGILSDVSFGINEVVVSAIGFLNFYLYQVYSKIFPNIES